ncbi:SDR family oxidoreductase [Piscinibacter terrae]|uniref:SDR family oxidoreductase n=1 Tax=Piscinibacter terrae TaxID=2496871 RepID=A0A3N7HMT1_9BURK|nr:SDR family oxidoreductase [Albitalea terrae]RQP23424.1 SDR family oxidoreductase [Albitalea terrae]
MAVLKDQKVVVLGGSSGVGLAVVKQAAADGAQVIAAGRDARRLDEALAGITGEVSGEVLDANDRTALDAFFARTGRVDHLVLTLSGGEGAGPFAQLDLDALRRGFEAKFWPQLQAAQASLPVLRAGGSITFVTAVSARIARPGTAGLAAINGALEAMVGSLARELAPTRVNAVSPGVIDTAWWSRVPEEARRAVFDEQQASLPAGRVGRPEDVAQSVRFLMDNGFVTGSVIECDGGLHLL